MIQYVYHIYTDVALESYVTYMSSINPILLIFIIIIIIQIQNHIKIVIT